MKGQNQLSAAADGAKGSFFGGDLVKQVSGLNAIAASSSRTLMMALRGLAYRLALVVHLPCS